MNEKEKRGLKPSFPNEEISNCQATPCFGISKRLYIATMAMQGILSAMASRPNMSIEEDVKLAFGYADEVLKQEEE